MRPAGGVKFRQIKRCEMRSTLILAAGCLWAIGPELSAQVVQLPSFSSFSVDTTVVVPDGGAALLGGVGRGSRATSEFGGIPRRRVSGVNRQVSGAYVRALVHDPPAAEAALARQAATERAADAELPLARTTPSAAGTLSLRDIERARAARADAAQGEARALLAKAQQSRADGKAGVARIYYRSAAKVATGDLRTTIERELRALDSPPAETRDKRVAR